MTSGAAGVLFYNNTILSETAAGSSANAHWRNNLILGESSAPPIFSVTTSTAYSSSDYNGFRPNPGAAYAFQWSAPQQQRFQTLSQYAQATGGRAQRARRYDIFVKVSKLDAQDRASVQKLPRRKTFRLKPNSPSIMSLLPGSPTALRAPRQTSVVSRQPLPHYGPRPQRRSGFSRTVGGVRLGIWRTGDQVIWRSEACTRDLGQSLGDAQTDGLFRETSSPAPA
jgi:hypothetical protein